MTDTDRKDPIAVLSDSSPVRLGLAIVVLAGVVALYNKIDGLDDGIRQEMASNYVSRDLFRAEMDAMRRENSIRADILSDQISELKATVSAARAAPPTGK